MTLPVSLFAPRGYVDASPEVRRAVANGCGPAGWKIDLVPDTLYGLDVSEACDIHDWMYHTGQSVADKESADRALRNNLLRLIDAKTRWAWLKWLRRRRARKYCWAVSEYGGPAFWDGKNRPENITPATD